MMKLLKSLLQSLAVAGLLLSAPVFSQSYGPVVGQSWSMPPDTWVSALPAWNNGTSPLYVNWSSVTHTMRYRMDDGAEVLPNDGLLHISLSGKYCVLWQDVIMVKNNSGGICQ